MHVKQSRKYPLRLFTIIIFVAIFFSNFSLFAQQDNNNSAFGAPVIKYTSLVGQDAVMLGGRFGWMIDKSIVLGGGIYSLVSNVKTNFIDPISGQNVILGLNCGGLEFEYIFFSDEPVHGSIDMLFAGGGVTYSVENKNVPHTSYFSQNLLVWEPQINIEFKIVDWFHLATGVSYRLISSYNGYFGITSNDLKGLTGLLTFKFGKY